MGVILYHNNYQKKIKTKTQNNRMIKAAGIINILVFFFILINVNTANANGINKSTKHNVTMSIQKHVTTETKTNTTNNTDNSVSSRIKRSNGQAIWVKGIQVLVFKYIPLAA